MIETETIHSSTSLRMISAYNCTNVFRNPALNYVPSREARDGKAKGEDR